MIKSMTGFASLTREGEGATVTVTAKGVNHRFLDLQLRMPSALAPVDTPVRVNAGSLTHRFPPASVTRLQLTLA